MTNEPNANAKFIGFSAAIMQNERKEPHTALLISNGMTRNEFVEFAKQQRLWNIPSAMFKGGEKVFIEAYSFLATCWTTGEGHHAYFETWDDLPGDGNLMCCPNYSGYFIRYGQRRENEIVAQEIT